MKFVDVLLPFGGAESNHPLTYRVPEELQPEIAIGDPVNVPFRRATATGYVVAASEEPGIPTKNILGKNAKMAPIGADMIRFSRWIATRYVSPWWEALRGFSFALNGEADSAGAADAPVSVPALTGEQERAAGAVRAAIDAGESKDFLLHGITGSGKTEVYLSCAARALEAGKEVLILVPEIPLSFQVAKRFEEAFGGRVAVLHSGLTDKERRDEQARFNRGGAPIVVGPRMALFAPFRKLGLIVVDEEHDPSYKQESHPRYNAVTLARMLARHHRAPLLLGSATPSLESRHAAERGAATLLTLASRYGSRPLPAVEVVDMRGGRESKQKLPFSAPLLDALHETVAAGNQAILFLNRRGFSPLVLCTDCGAAIQCPRCNIALTLHLDKGLLICHYCNHRKQAAQICPACGGSELTRRGFGTQRLEEELANAVPSAKILRLDRDSASKRGAGRAIVEAFAKKEAQILIGTQMVTKGFDFPDVGLVGILNADQLLHFPDFRSGERTFQLLTQVAGRAGRGNAGGKVILQTYDPEHPAIVAAAGHDYDSFYAQELKSRKEVGYPPFARLANILVSGEDDAVVEAAADGLREFLGKRIPQGKELWLLGPSPAPMQKINRNFRWHILVKSAEIDPLLRLGRDALAWHARSGSRKIRVTVDVDPVHLL